MQFTRAVPQVRVGLVGTRRHGASLAGASGLLIGIERTSKSHWKMEGDDMLDAMLMSTPILTGTSGR